MNELKLKLKCPDCGNIKEVGEEQQELLMCEKCFAPMLAEEAKLKSN